MSPVVDVFLLWFKLVPLCGEVLESSSLSRARRKLCISDPKGSLMPESSANRYVFAIATVAAMGGFLFGFDSGVINGTVDALQTAFRSDAVGTGFSVASMLLGCAVGALFAGTLADRFGRRPVMVITAVVFLVSALGSGWARDSAEFVFYRVVGGLAVGAASVIAPMYISEVAPAAWRGRLSSLQQLAIVVGLFVVFLSNYALAQWAGGAKESLFFGFAAWRWMFWMEVIPAVAYLAGSMFVPESPRYLVSRGDYQRANTVLARIDRTHASTILAQIQETLAEARPPRWTDLFDASRRIHPVIWVGAALAVFQQLVGINVIFYYGAVLWKAAGFSESEALGRNIISGAVNLASTFVAIALVDRIGRKPLLLIGSIGMAVCLLVTAGAFATADVGPDGQVQLSSAAGTLALWMANGYVVCFAATWGPVLWVLLGEMFSNRIRGAAIALATMLHWLGNFTVTITFPILLRSVGLAAAYTLYASAALISFFFVKRFVQETRNMTLEEM